MLNFTCMIIIKDLTVSYTSESTVIDSLCHELSGRSIHGIVGLKRAGKPTVLHTIYGIKKADSGEISFNGKRLSQREIS